MPPISLMIKPVSGRCNLACRYCFYADEQSSRAQADRGVMADDTLEALLRKAFSHAEHAVYIALQGGEPTLAGPDFLRKLLELERRYNRDNLPVQNSMQTNGQALDEEMIQLLAEHNVLVGLSVDGCQALHDEMRGAGSYVRTMETARRLMDAGVQVNALCVVTKPLADAAAEAFDCLADAFRYLQFIPCLEMLDGEARPWSLTPDSYGRFLKITFQRYFRRIQSGKPVSVRNFDNYVSILRGFPPENCAMNGHCSSQYVVEADGSVYPCDFYALDSWYLGNIRDTSFPRLAASQAAMQFLESSRSHSQECDACPYALLCGGGCRRERSSQNKSRFCSAYRDFFAKAMDQLLLLRDLPQTNFPT